MSTLKHTPLHAKHIASGARMVDFGGWDMPVNYGSQIEEHHAVRKDAGIFDVSHMRVVDINGDKVRDFLRYVLANNVDKLQTSGKALYSCMLRPEGGVIDDLIVYFFTEDYFRLVVNAGTADKDIEWLNQQNAEGDYGLTITPRPDMALIAVQGPMRARRRGTLCRLSKPHLNHLNRSTPHLLKTMVRSGWLPAPATPAKMALKSLCRRIWSKSLGTH